jgi:hypothetical protein
MKQNKKCEMAKGSRTLVRLWARFQWTIPAGDARQSHCVHPSRRGEASTHMCSWLPLIHTLTSDYVIFNLISWLPFPSTNNVGLNFALSPCINESSRFSMNYCEFKSAKPTKKNPTLYGSYIYAEWNDKLLVTYSATCWMGIADYCPVHIRLARTNSGFNTLWNKLYYYL